MSRFFPHATFAEDQPLAHTVLTTHVLTRGAQVGALLGMGSFGVRSAIRAMRGSSSGTATTAARPVVTAAVAAGVPPAAPAPMTATPPASIRLLRAAGTGTAVGVVLLGVALAARMQGRGDIEWQDRAWRLRANRGQTGLDDWTYGAAAAGLVGALASGGAGRLGWRGVVGAAGAGGVVGMVGFMAWQVGVNGGKTKEKKRVV